MQAIRVLIADDEKLVRHALRIFVDTSGDMEVVGEATDGDEAVALAAQLLPDVVLMDLQMPRVSGIEATRRIMRVTSEVRVLAVTTFSTERHVVPALRAGASGYLVKDTDPDDILNAIREVAAGRSAMSPRLTRDLILSLRDNPAEESVTVARPEPLTPRELSIVKAIAHGRSNAEIARELHLAEPTVKANLGRVMSKWGVRDRVQVLIYAITNNLVELGSLDSCGHRGHGPADRE
ncbi:two component transcriptional regulator, LuxR family [Microbacterium testaceum StLB037]|uniref:Two component transcriptional regulator, LuxR family n=1 Tax=Microbacterium testaceum (strain StLB037) TaxID=979556 RepID=A0A1H0NJ90_MICTS|nr:response regulator transcription factor [Microbacterium testaceum]SDO92485.1 two component transcriptional regulator, LuxR family [Microbacterium testaceum StLB037]